MPPHAHAFAHGVCLHAAVQSRVRASASVAPPRMPPRSCMHAPLQACMLEDAGHGEHCMQACMHTLHASMHARHGEHCMQACMHTGQKATTCQSVEELTACTLAPGCIPLQNGLWSITSQDSHPQLDPQHACAPTGLSPLQSCAADADTASMGVMGVATAPADFCAYSSACHAQ